MPYATIFSDFGKQIVVITLILWATFNKHILKKLGDKKERQTSTTHIAFIN